MDLIAPVFSTLVRCLLAAVAPGGVDQAQHSSCGNDSRVSRNKARAEQPRDDSPENDRCGCKQKELEDGDTSIAIPLWHHRQRDQIQQAAEIIAGVCPK